MVEACGSWYIFYHRQTNRNSYARQACAVIENYFEGELLRDGEEYLTTKSDKNYHGYGIKSIRYAVDKYHGIASAGVEDGWFRIKIMLPLEQSE